jgi:Protein of unknown function (DUF1592)/Protein of unknown function (DUF1588)/Protein of unknown function (DUF1585)/Protein of unknown function (DUF1587)/Protein of unknown function (DUF1595)
MRYMMKVRVLALLGVAIAGTGTLTAAGQEPSTSNPSHPTSERTLLNRYCVVCHNSQLKVAGLMLDKMNVEKPSEDPQVWEKVTQKLRTRTMPPAGLPRPDNATYDSLATYLTTAIDKAATADPNPGHPAAYHRLNGAEYTNAIRDLLALDVGDDSLLPADASAGGFDNNAAVLSMSPLLMDRYLIAARHISQLALGSGTTKPTVTNHETPGFSLQQQRASEDLPLGSRGGIAIRYYFPLDGQYVVKVRLKKTRGLPGGKIMGVGEPHQLDVRLDGERIKLLTFGGEKGLTPNQVEDALEVRFPAKAGMRTLGVTFMNEYLEPEDMLRPPTVEMQLDGWGPRSDPKRDPGVESVSIDGPYDATGPGDTASRQKILVCHPRGGEDDDVCAKKILSSLARRAYRRPVTDADMKDLLGFYRAGRDSQKSGESLEARFEAGIGMALQEMLVSPNFLFRAEPDPPHVAPGTAYRISDLELASRLSFFLWSSIPDDQLLDLAARGKLREPGVLQQQVKRMLADSRSKALVDNFFGQWLDLRGLPSVFPDQVAFVKFDDDLRQGFEQEMDLLLTNMLHKDSSVVDLLNANYTFVNQRLAHFYGIPNVYGSRFRPVTLTDEKRFGLLGKGAILMATSFGNRTSPTLRGKWVLDNIIGNPPNPPPANVPPFPENTEEHIERLTVRQKMEEHRANPLCASCHAGMDPLGFALENFNAIGGWRTNETIQLNAVYNSQAELPLIENPIDNSGVLPDGTKFNGPVGLQKILIGRPELFVHVTTEKLFTYALGRQLEYYDEPAVRKVVRDSTPTDYRWSSIIMGIVNSTPFQMRMSAAGTSNGAPDRTVAALH